MKTFANGNHRLFNLLKNIAFLTPIGIVFFGQGVQSNLAATSCTHLEPAQAREVREDEMTPSSRPLIRSAKGIIRKAAEIGLEEAGTRILGPTAWGYFKRLFEPVWTELEARFPELLLLDTPAAADAAESAVKALDCDDHLQAMLVEGFKALEEGQVMITAELTRVNETLSDLDSSLEDTRAMSRTILDRLDSERSRLPTKGLHEVSLFATIDAAKHLDELQKNLTKWSFGQKHYIDKILEYGEAFTTYSFVLPMCLVDDGFSIQPTEHRFEAAGNYRGQEGQTCRNTVLSWARPDGEWERHENTYCRVQGSWARLADDELPTLGLSGRVSGVKTLADIHRVVAEQLGIGVDEIDVAVPLNAQPIPYSELDLIEILITIDQLFGVNLDDHSIGDDISIQDLAKIIDREMVDE